MDFISEHQRDLSNSATGRFYFEYFCFAHMILLRSTEILNSLFVDEKSIKKNILAAGDSVYAEAFYIHLSWLGVKDAHDKIRKASQGEDLKAGDLAKALKKQKLLEKGFDWDTFQAKYHKGSELKLKALMSELKWGK